MRRMMVLGLVAVACVAPALPAQQAATVTLPDAHALVARYVEAIGGRAAVMDQTGRHGIGRFELPSQGISGEFELFAVAPNRMVMRADIPGIGESSGGYDGETGWAINPALGPMVLEGRMLDQMRQQANFRAPLHTEFIASMETVEEVEFEGMACYKVKVTTTWDEEYYEFFDKERGLLVGTVRQQATPMGEIEATTVFSEFQRVGGLLVPLRSVQRMMGMEQVFAIETLEASSVPDSVFTLPDQIKALIGQ